MGWFRSKLSMTSQNGSIGSSDVSSSNLSSWVNGLVCLVLILLCVPACTSSGSGDAVNGGGETDNGNDGGDTVNDDDNGNEGVVTDAQNAVFAGVAYTTARANLNNIVTGRPLGDTIGKPEDNTSGPVELVAFAMDPSVIDDLINGVETDCALGGTIVLESVNNGDDGIASLTSNYVYDNCGLDGGVVDGTISITTYQATTTIWSSTSVAVMLNGPDFDAVLNGTELTQPTTSSDFNPVEGCNITNRTQVDTSRVFDNTTIVDKRGSETITHYYSSLNHLETNITDENCGVQSERTSHSSSATYTRTDTDETISFEVTKSGEVLAGDLEFIDVSSVQIAQLDASVDVQDQAPQTLSIVASDVQGSSLEITLNDGDNVSTFSEELNFRNLSN